MGNDRICGCDPPSRTAAPAQAPASQSRESLEIEAKCWFEDGLRVNPCKLVKVSKIVEVDTVSEHMFYYDAEDRYRFSVTDDRKVKTKGLSSVIVVDGATILSRREKVEPWQHQYHASHFRTLKRVRTSVEWRGFFVAVDRVIAEGKTLYQLEVENHGEDSVSMLTNLAETFKLAVDHLGIIPLGGLPLEKGEWLKLQCPALTTEVQRDGWVYRVLRRLSK